MFVLRDESAHPHKGGTALLHGIARAFGNVDFQNPDTFYLRALEQSTVLEVKYDAFLPELVRMAVQVPGRQAAACSKYAVCRRFD